MTESNSGSSEPAWLAQSLRMTFFHSGTGSATPRGWFSLVAGKAPEEIVERGSRVQEKGAIASPESPLHGQLIVSHVPGRTDWIVIEPQADLSKGIPNVGPYA